MKKKLTGLLLLLLPFCLMAQSDMTKGIQFEQHESWKQIRAKAKKLHKYIFVDCYATWCGPCKMMDRDIYSDTTVGKEVNKQFISVKVQVDKTANDSKKIRDWYPDAAQISNQYQVKVLPTFLFFAPDGKLADRDEGYKNPIAFTSLTARALTDPLICYGAMQEKFKNRKLSYDQMPKLLELSIEMKNIALALNVLKKYKEGYLDELDDAAILTKKNLSFLAQYGFSVINSGDRYFRFFLDYPDSVDRIMETKVPFSAGMAFNIIKKYEINNKLYDQNGKPLQGITTDWQQIESAISTKYPQRRYPSIDARKMVLNARTDYYWFTKNWPEHIRAFTERTDLYGVGSINPAFPVLTSNAIVKSILMHCEDTIILKKAAAWCQICFVDYELKPICEQADKQHDFKKAQLTGNNSFSDYAGFLYKLGKKEEAIKWVGWHIALMDADEQKEEANKPAGFEKANDPGYLYYQKSRNNKLEILKRMKNNERIDDTWQAEWFF